MESILQYFQPSLSYHLSLRSLFRLFLVAVLHRFYCIVLFKHTRINTYFSSNSDSLFPEEQVGLSFVSFCNR